MYRSVFSALDLAVVNFTPDRLYKPTGPPRVPWSITMSFLAGSTGFLSCAGRRPEKMVMTSSLFRFKLGTARLRSSMNCPTAFSGGVGLRLALQRKEKINFRVHIGFSDSGDIGTYFTVLEAF